DGGYTRLKGWNQSPKAVKTPSATAAMGAPTRLDKPKQAKAPLPKLSHCEPTFARVFTHSLGRYLLKLCSATGNGTRKNVTNIHFVYYTSFFRVGTLSRVCPSLELHAMRITRTLRGSLQALDKS
ncbi:MAG: hypothetical protein U1D35_00310, partial [Paracoccaceae bacterium]|nr:hypothetical protein [Paracoccaceae bacterium]